MCTVSYIPSGEGFFLTSNRDEAPGRNIRTIATERLKSGVQAKYPQDPQSKGSWIACGDSGRVVCLLNGGFEAHQRKAPYRLSRGIVVLEAMDEYDISGFMERFDFNGIEPFTLLSFQDNQVLECVWDGNRRHLMECAPDQSQIWSSSTLYNPLYRKKRAELFYEWRAGNEYPSQSDIFRFHQSGGTGDKYNDFVMNRGDVVRTISITGIRKATGRIQPHSFGFTQQIHRAGVYKLFQHSFTSHCIAYGVGWWCTAYR